MASKTSLCTTKNNSPELEYDENILEYLLHHQNNENDTQSISEPETDADDEKWDSYMNYLRKTLRWKKIVDNQKSISDFDELTLDTDEEKMLLEEHNVVSTDLESVETKKDRLLEVMEKRLANPFPKSIYQIPQGFSSPKLICDQSTSSANKINNSELMSDSLGYYSFKSNMTKCITSQTIEEFNEHDKLEKYEKESVLVATENKSQSSTSSSEESPIKISLISSDENDENIEKHETENRNDNSMISFKSKTLQIAIIKPNNIVNETDTDLIFCPVLEELTNSKTNPFQPLENSGELPSSKNRKRKLRRKKKKNVKQNNEKKNQNLTPISPNTISSVVSNSLENEVKLPAEKRIKIDEEGNFHYKSITNISVVFEKRKSINFISGGIVKAGIKNNYKDVTKQLIKNQTNTEDYQTELKKLLKTPGGIIILKMGYEIGKGLGKNLHGILQPIEAYIRKGRGSIGSYGSEMSLQTSIKIQEQYKILKSLSKNDLFKIKDNSNFQPGIYSSVNFDYSTLPNPFLVNINNNFKDYNINSPETSLANDNNTEKCKIMSNNCFQLIITSLTGNLYLDKIQEIIEILEKTVINAATLNEVGLQFESVNIKHNALEVNCVNEKTYVWIEKLISNSGRGQFLPGIQLIVKKFINDEVPVAVHKMEIFIPGKTLKTIEYFKILESQNPGLKTEGWKIYKRNEIKNGVEIVIGIGERSLKTLENVYKMHPYLGLKQIKFNSKDSRY